MHFAYPFPWWLAVVLAAAIGAVVYFEYRRPLSPLTRTQRGALAAVRERYRGQRVAGIIVLSDGGDTGTGEAGRAGRAGGAGDAGGPPVFAIGIGSPEGPRDREVLGITAGDPRLDHSSVDLHVTAVSSGFGRTPFTLRVLGNGQLLDTRRIVPPADGSPIDEVFTVSPDPVSPTVYSGEIPRDPVEPVVE